MYIYIYKRQGQPKAANSFRREMVIFYTSIGSIGSTNGSEVCVCVWGEG